MKKIKLGILLDSTYVSAHVLNLIEVILNDEKFEKPILLIEKKKEKDNSFFKKIIFNIKKKGYLRTFDHIIYYIEIV